MAVEVGEGHLCSGGDGFGVQAGALGLRERRAGLNKV